MAIALRGTATGSTAASGADLTINVPTGVVNGDVMIAIIEGNALGKTIPTPTGWTAIDSYNANTPSAASFFRVASSEPASYTWANTALATFTSGSIIAYSGVSGTPINAHGAFNRQASNTAPLANSITTTVDGCQILYLVGANGGPGTITAPTGFTNRTPVGPNVIVADESQATAGATGSATGGMTSAATTTSQLIALAPAVAAPTNTVAPAVTGSATVGSTLTTDNGTWTGSPTSFTYQWTSNGVNVGSNQNTYVTQAGDVGHAVGCTVTATNAGGSASQASNTITVTGASLSTVIAKAGTSGSAVMQKAKASWTYITQKTGTSGTAVDQKGAGSFTKIKGH